MNIKKIVEIKKQKLNKNTIFLIKELVLLKDI